MLTSHLCLQVILYKKKLPLPTWLDWRRAASTMLDDDTDVSEFEKAVLASGGLMPQVHAKQKGGTIPGGLTMSTRCQLQL